MSNHKNQQQLTVDFLGGAGTVTGSKYLLRGGRKELLVDCGLFQGLKKLRLLNWEPFPMAPSELDGIVLTHGHLDHCGYLPKLVREEFSGPVFGTEPSLKIAEIILKDSAKIQEEEAERANREGYTKHDPAKPLYTVEDAEEAISRFKPLPPDTWHEPVEGFDVRFRKNGHILGSTFIEITHQNHHLVFSGDVGRPEDELMEAPEKPEQADVLFLESTYGNKIHNNRDPREELKKVVRNTKNRGGTLLIPSFAVERAQTLMYLLWDLKKSNEIPDLPVYLDTPMGISVSHLFDRFKHWHKLKPGTWKQVCSGVEAVELFEETRQIARNTEPKIVIAGSGMITGGRILHYLKHYITDRKSTLLITGYQAAGTRGRLLLEGIPELKFYGEYYPVRITVKKLDGMSAHADQKELIDWCSRITKPPEHTFLIHGEPPALDALRVRLKDKHGWNLTVPDLHEQYKL